MKHFYQRLLISAFLLICAILANAEVIDGIAYTLNGNTKTASVKKRDGNYSGDIVIPETITYHDVTYSVTSIDYGAFWGCSDLTSITIPNSVTSIGENAFYGCIGLTSITIPKSVTSIGERAFFGCHGLTSITIPNSVTYIGELVFCNCKVLYSITIPNTVTSIEDSAFSSCTGLTSVNCSISNPACLNKFAFYRISSTIYVPIGTKEAYESRGFQEFRGTFVEMDMTGIEETTILQAAKPSEYYNLKGQRINRPDRGVVIVKYSDGTSRKVMMK